MRRWCAVLVGMLIVAGCGGETGPDGSGGGSATGPGISVQEAIQSDLSDPLLVNGYLFVDPEGEMTLAELLAESFPPQPAGATLRVQGLDLSEVEDLETAQGVSWTQDYIQLLGTVQDGELIVSGVSTG